MVESNGMLLDIRRRGMARKRLLSTCQAAVPALAIAMTSASCSGPAGNMPEPSYRIVERELPLSTGLTGGEKQHSARRTFDEQPRLRTEQHATSPAPKPAKLRGPEDAPVSSRVLQKENTPPLLSPQQKRLYQQFLEWRSQQRDTPQ